MLVIAIGLPAQRGHVAVRIVGRRDAAHAVVLVEVVDAVRDVLVGGRRQDVLRVADRLARQFPDEIIRQRVIQRIAGEAVVEDGEIVVSLERQIGPRPRRVVADDGGALGLVTVWF